MDVTCPRCRFEYDDENDPWDDGDQQFIHAEIPDTEHPEDGKYYAVAGSRCPKCRQFIVWAEVPETKLICPRVDLRKSVLDEFHKGFREACRILEESPNSSAAASRRCLQIMIRQHFGINKKDLYPAIKELVAQNRLPSALAEDLYIIKDFGNRGAHPSGSTTPGDDIEVEVEEAQWLLEILERLFEFEFIAPRLTEERRQAFNEKRTRAGKSPLDFSATSTRDESEGPTIQ